MFDETAQYSPKQRGVTFEFRDQLGEPCVGWVSLEALIEIVGKDLSGDSAVEAYQNNCDRIHSIVARKIIASQGYRVFVEDLFG